jgi:hypothetical protein
VSIVESSATSEDGLLSSGGVILSYRLAVDGEVKSAGAIPVEKEFERKASRGKESGRIRSFLERMRKRRRAPQDPRKIRCKRRSSLKVRLAVVTVRELTISLRIA